MKEVPREFLARLSEEEDNFAEKLKLDNTGVGLITAIKEFDCYYFNLVRHERSDDSEHQFQIMRLGLPRLIAGVLSGVPQFRYTTVTFRSDRALILGALEMVAALGFIEEGRRMAQAALAGECEIRRINERQYDVVLPDPVLDMEQHEASVEHHYIRQQRQYIDKAIEEAFGKTDTKVHIDALLKDNVYVFREHFIGYDAHPDLDDFFFGLANLELQTQSGYDTFNWRTQFGGVTMQKYTLATAYLLSLALKHERFAMSLVRKSPQIRLRDVLTITKEKIELEESVIEALNWWGPSFEGFTPVTPEEAKTILRVLSVRRDNISILSSTMAPTPFLIEFSDTAWIASTAGLQIGAVDFLHNSLRHNFPGDYDRNQQAREGSMQRALRQLLDEHLPGLTYVDNVTIRRGGKILTDIDFGVIDASDGTVMLFQLKHQDHYGGDMKRRSNRAARLKKEVDHWLASVRAWISEGDAMTFNSALRLGKNFTCQRIYLMVVARHFAHFLSTSDLKVDAAYATWIQLFDALNRLRVEERPQTLAEFFAILQQYMSHKIARGIKMDELYSYHLPSLSYRIRPESAG